MKIHLNKNNTLLCIKIKIFNDFPKTKKKEGRYTNNNNIINLKDTIIIYTRGYNLNKRKVYTKENLM